MIYVDHAATTPLSPAALAAMLPFRPTNGITENLTEIPSSEEAIWGNPSSLHAAGRRAAEALVAARRRIGAAIGAEAEEIVFTSGGTEADNQAIRTVAAIGEAGGKRHILVSPLEHPAMRRPLTDLAERGFSVERLPVESDGRVSPDAVAARLRADTVAVAVMYASNEIGTIQPISAIGRVCRASGVLFVCDAVQAVGHLPVDVRADGVDLLTISAHKLYGPQGVGAFYVRRGIAASSLLLGGGQEHGRRAGTENLPAILGFSAAMEESVARMEADTAHLRELSERLMEGLLAIPGTQGNGSREHRLPGVVSVSFAGIAAEGLLYLLDSRGICASAGSACAAGSLEPSPTLMALGHTSERALGTVRFSLGRGNTAEEVDEIVRTVAELVERLRG